MRRYFIVDDNQAFAENVAEILTDGGAQVDLASLGAEALERAARVRYDALVSDMRMPVMGGAELVHRVRRVDPALPAIVVTAYTHDSDLEAARSEGLLAVLPKPVPIGRLAELLDVARRDGLVVLVEDDLALLDNLTETLQAHGFAAVTATSVLETERLGDVRPFAAIVDLRVPGGADGVAMRRLVGRFPGLPILVLTAHADPDQPLPVKPVARFSKPARTSDLVGVLERVHRERHAG